MIYLSLNIHLILTRQSLYHKSASCQSSVVLAFTGCLAAGVPPCDVRYVKMNKTKLKGPKPDYISYENHLSECTVLTGSR